MWARPTSKFYRLTKPIKSSAHCELQNTTDLIILNLFTIGQGATTKLRHHLIRAKKSLSAKPKKFKFENPLHKNAKSSVLKADAHRRVKHDVRHCVALTSTSKYLKLTQRNDARHTHKGLIHTAASCYK